MVTMIHCNLSDAVGSSETPNKPHKTPLSKLGIEHPESYYDDSDPKKQILEREQLMKSEEEANEDKKERIPRGRRKQFPKI